VINLKISEVDRNRISPMMLHYLEVKDNYPDAIVFYRLGDFYEMFFEDAITVSHELELTLTGRNASLDERVPMCGVPHHAKDIYIEKLVKKGYKVAICEQVEEASNTKKMVKREVCQIVSAGTVLDNNSLNEKENNYVGGIYDFDHCYTITYADITTGEVFVKVIDHNDNKLISEILEIGIKELIVNEKLDKLIISNLKSKYNLVVSIIDNLSEDKIYKYIYEQIEDSRCVIGIKHIIYYLCNNSKREISHMQKAIFIDNEDYLKMDIHTIRNLELVENLRLKDRSFSLLGLLDNTKTAMGSRKLKSYITKPIIDKDVLNKRYDIVSKLLEEFILCEDLRSLLYEVYDLERLSGRISLGTCNARDLLQLKNSIKVLPDIKKILNSIGFYEDVLVLDDLYQLLDNAIYEDPPVSIKEGYIIKDGYCNELDDL